VWFFIATSVIISFFAYQFKVVDFTFMELNLSGDSSCYYHNILLKNVMSYRVFDYSVPKISWYIFEAGILSFFLGLNIVIADSFCSHTRHKRTFKMINLPAVFLTFPPTSN